MIHAQTVRRDQLERMKKLHMIPSFFIAHTYYWGDVHRKQLGKRAYAISGAYRARAGSSVYVSSRYAGFAAGYAAYRAVCRYPLDGNRSRARSGGMYLSLEALRGVTVNAAYQYFEEKEKGSIQVGKRADLVVLSANPLKVPANEIGKIEVLVTIKEGSVQYRKA